MTPHPLASRLYTEEGFQNGLRLLRGAGARITIMTSTGPCGAPGVGGGQGEAWGDWLRRRGQEWNPWQKPLVAAQARLTWDGRGQRSVLEERVGARRGVRNGRENSGRARETWGVPRGGKSGWPRPQAEERVPGVKGVAGRTEGSGAVMKGKACP